MCGQDNFKAYLRHAVYASIANSAKKLQQYLKLFYYYSEHQCYAAGIFDCKYNLRIQKKLMLGLALRDSFDSYFWELIHMGDSQKIVTPHKSEFQKIIVTIIFFSRRVKMELLMLWFAGAQIIQCKQDPQAVWKHFCTITTKIPNWLSLYNKN